MYKRYIKQFEMHPDVTAKLRQEENIIMPQLRVYAEHLKYDLNERCGEEYSSGWDDYEDEKALQQAAIWAVQGMLMMIPLHSLK